jgi:hypothetical protein
LVDLRLERAQKGNNDSTTIVNRAVIEEEAVKQFKMLIDRVAPQRHMGFNNNAGNTSANPTSFATRQVHYDPQEQRNLGKTTAGLAYDTDVVASPLPGPVDQYAPLVTPTYVCFATTALSQAEKALRESSGVNAPVQCWGCEGPHLWRDCPKKSDEECHKRFTENLAKYTEHRCNRANRFDPAQYKRDGFPSKVASS